MDLTIDKHRHHHRRVLVGSDVPDSLTYMCVNPYEVNPVPESSNTSSASAALLTDVPLKLESSVSLRNPVGIEGGVFYDPQRKIKLEMEEFGDLSPFVSQKKMILSSIDELNTPIFDKDAFDFDISNYQNDVQADLHVMLKCDAAFYRENTLLNNNTNRQNNINNCQEDVFLNMENMHRNTNNINNNNNNQQLQHTDAIMYSPAASENGTYLDDMNNSVSVNVSNDTNFNYRLMLDTPDGSDTSYGSSSPVVKPRLSLDIGSTNHNNNTNNGHLDGFLDVNTPSIIAEVVNLEATGFNLLDLINDDHIDEVFPIASTSNQPRNQITPAKKLPRKRRLIVDDEDDEDYVPPKMQISATNSTRSSLRDCTDSESEVELEKPKKSRGRPPKRAESVSSDCSKDSDISKYRELRDKNNEASRKSRLKRKTKEMELEKESDELHNKNIKLKAQVEELEKMVNNFRDNLFKIMIRK